MRVQPLHGRWFTAEEDVPNGPPVDHPGARAVAAALRERPGDCRQAIHINGEPRTVVGVMPAGFTYPGASQAWVPLGGATAPAAAGELPATGRTDEAWCDPGAGAAGSVDRVGRLQPSERHPARCQGVGAARHHGDHEPADAPGAAGDRGLRAAGRVRQRGEPAARRGASARQRELAIRSAIGARRRGSSSSC